VGEGDDEEDHGERGGQQEEQALPENDLLKSIMSGFRGGSH